MPWSAMAGERSAPSLETLAEEFRKQEEKTVSP